MCGGREEEREETPEFGIYFSYHLYYSCERLNINAELIYMLIH